MQYKAIEVKEIHRDEVNPTTRKPDADLVASIKEHGILSPIIVRKNGNGYIIIAGERRWLAAQELKMETVPCVVRDEQGDDATALLLSDNIHRKDMTLYEEYSVIKKLLKTKTPHEVAKTLNKTTQYVVQRAQLDNLVPSVLKLVKDDVTGFTAKIAFIFARLPKSLQIRLTDELHVITNTNGKTLMNTEKQLETSAKRLIQDSLFSNELSAVEMLQIYGNTENVGEVSVEHVMDTLFDDKKITDTDVAKEDLKEMKKLTKMLEGMKQVSTKNYVYGKEILPSTEWRVATKEDDAADTFEAIYIDGPKVGIIGTFVKVNPKVEEKKAKKPLTEKEKKERKEKIIVNKATNASHERLFDLCYTNEIKIDERLIKFVIGNIDYNKQARMYKALCPDKDVEFANLGKELWNQIKGLSPANALQFLLTAPYITFRADEIADLHGIKLNDLIKEEKALIKEQQKEKETK